jgi:hypothetical protein
MKFLRNLTPVVLAVAVIVGLGLLWAHVYGGGTGQGAGTGPGTTTRIRHLPPRAALLRLGHGQAGLIGRAGQMQAHTSGFQLADASNLIRTILIEAVLAAAVIAVSVAWRRHRRMQRAALSA